MNKKVAVIGGGITGMATASALVDLGIEVVLFEKEMQTGGHVRNWDRLFPSRRPAEEVTGFLEKGLATGVDLRVGAKVTSVERKNGGFMIRPEKGQGVEAASVVLCMGFDLFDARKKEEYGYGIYDNVITSAELEAIFRSGRKITMHDGRIPARIALIHCVGSRDEKVGNLYCSKVCCVTGVKQAIEIREMLPLCEVYCFYMDLRMFDRNFEELYLEAQQKWGVNFIRGRLSECAENQDHSLALKTEDTLTGKPLKIKVDLMVLLAGFIPRPESAHLSRMLGLQTGSSGFVLSDDQHLLDNDTFVPGVFLAGAVKGPSGITEAVADGRATALRVVQYLNTASDE